MGKNRINHAGQGNSHYLITDYHRRQIGKNNRRLVDKDRSSAQNIAANTHSASTRDARASAGSHIAPLSSHQQALNAQVPYVSPKFSVSGERLTRDHVASPAGAKAQAFLSLATLVSNIRPDLADVRARYSTHAAFHPIDQSAPILTASESTRGLHSALHDVDGENGSLHHVEVVRQARSADTDVVLSSATRQNQRLFSSASSIAVTPSVIHTLSTLRSPAAKPISTIAAASIDISATASLSGPSSTRQKLVPWEVQTLRDGLISYVQERINFSAGDHLNSALKAYLHSAHRQRGGDERAQIHHEAHPFFTDWELQDYLLDKLAWPHLESMLHNQEVHIKNALAQCLVLAVTSDIDFSKIRGDSSVTYQNQVFKGLNGRPILEARHQALQYGTLAIQDALKIDRHQAKHLAKIRLTSMAPELAALKHDDPSLSEIKYGSRAWGELLAGVIFSKSIGIDLHRQTGAQLRQLGLSAMAHTRPVVSQSGSITISHDLDAQPISTVVTARMAFAQGVVDPNTQTLDEVAQGISAFVAEEFKEEIAQAAKQAEWLQKPVPVREAIVQLANPEPTRKKIAQEILRSNGQVPEQEVEVDIYPPVISQGPRPQQFRSLLELYLDRDLEAPPVIIVPNGYVGKMLKRLPSVNQKFDQAFQEYKTNSTQALTTVLADALQTRVTQPLNDPNTYVTSHTVELYYDQLGAGRGTGLVDEDERLTRKKATSTGALFIHVHTAAQGTQRFVFVHNQQDKGLQELPSGMTATDWAASHRRDIFDGTFVDTAERFQDSQGLRFREKERQSGNFDTILHAAAARFVNDNMIKPRYDRAYGSTSLEQGREFFRDLLIPFYSAIQAVRKGNTEAAIVDGAMDALGFIPVIGSGTKFISGGAKLLINSAKVIKTMLTGDFAAGVLKFVATTKHAGPRLATQGGHFALTLLDAVSPIPLPSIGLSKKLHMPSQHVLGEMAQALAQSNPSFAEHIDQLRRYKVDIQHGKWVAADPADIYIKNGKPHYTVNGHDYMVMQLDGQAHVLVKAYPASHSGAAYITQANPLTGGVDGAYLYLASNGRAYPNLQSTRDHLLLDYAERALAIDPEASYIATMARDGASTYRSKNGQDVYIRVGDRQTDRSPFYRVQKESDGSFYIIPPHRHNMANLAAIGHPLPTAKIPVEVADGQWRVILDNVPEKFKNIRGAQTSTWKYNDQGKEFIVAYLADGNRVVPLEPVRGYQHYYREVYWETGQPIAYQHLVHQDADGFYSRSNLQGGVRKRKIDGTPASCYR